MQLLNYCRFNHIFKITTRMKPAYFRHLITSHKNTDQKETNIPKISTKIRLAENVSLEKSPAALKSTPHSYKVIIARVQTHRYRITTRCDGYPVRTNNYSRL